MNDHEHSIICAVFLCANEILVRGLEQLVLEREREKSIFTSEELCRLCSSLVLAQSSTILSSLSSILERHKFCSKIRDVVTVTTEVRSASAIVLDKPRLTFCAECEGEHGRMLCTTQGVGRGHVLLQERPYAYTIASQCGCKEGNMLVEHVALACAILASRQKNAAYFHRFMVTFVSGLSSGPTHRSSYLSDLKHHGGNGTVREDGSAWPRRMQLQMALVAAILCLYEAHTEFTAQYGPTTDLTASIATMKIHTVKESSSCSRSSSPLAGKEGRSKSPSTTTRGRMRPQQGEEGAVDMKAVWKERIFSDAWLLMQILGRLPQNTHAISRVVTTSNSTSTSASNSSTSTNNSTSSGGGVSSREVQQVRVGYAVFLVASSINHSCRPNATIRYSTPNSSSSSSTSSSSGMEGTAGAVAEVAGVTRSNKGEERHGRALAARVLSYLRDVSIEIVSTESMVGYRPSRASQHDRAAEKGSGSTPSSLDPAVPTMARAYDTPGEVTVSYGPLHGPHSVAQRQSVLQQQYLFTCTCTACVSDLQALVQQQAAAKDAHLQRNAAATHGILNSTTTSRSRSHHVLQRLDQVQGATLGQVEAVTRSAVLHTQHLAQAAQDTRHLQARLVSLTAQLGPLNTLFTDVLHQARQQRGEGQQYDNSLLHAFEVKKLRPIEEALVQLEQTYFPPTPETVARRKQLDYCGGPTSSSSSSSSQQSVYASDPLYADYCSAYCNYLDMAAHLLALREEYPAAAAKIHQALLLLLDGRLYEASDVVVGRERVKLAGLLLSCGQRAACLAQARCAVSILLPVVDASDPDLVEAKHIYAYCLKQIPFARST